MVVLTHCGYMMRVRLVVEEYRRLSTIHRGECFFNESGFIDAICLSYLGTLVPKWLLYLVVLASRYIRAALPDSSCTHPHRRLPPASSATFT